MIMKSFFFADRLNFLTYLVNVGNAVVAFAIVIVWCATKSGEKAAWMKVIEHMLITLSTQYTPTSLIITHSIHGA